MCQLLDCTKSKTTLHVLFSWFYSLYRFSIYKKAAQVISKMATECYENKCTQYSMHVWGAPQKHTFCCALGHLCLIFLHVQSLCIIHLFYRHAKGSRQHRLILARDKRRLCDKAQSREVSFPAQTSSTCRYVCVCLWLSAVFLSTSYHFSEPLLCGALLSLPLLFSLFFPPYISLFPLVGWDIWVHRCSLELL